MNAAAPLVEAGVDCVIRHAVEADKPLIFSSWVKGAFEVWPAEMTPRVRFIPKQQAHVTRTLERASTLVAVHPDDPGAVLGYLCHELRAGILIVHWAYTKRPFRSLGVGRLLLETAKSGASRGEHVIVFTQPSKHVRWLSKRLPLAFDPYLLEEL